MTEICKAFSVDALHNLLSKLVSNPEEVFVKSSDLTIDTAARATILFFERREDKIVEFINALAYARSDVKWHEIAEIFGTNGNLTPRQLSLPNYSAQVLQEKSLFKSRDASILKKDPQIALEIYAPIKGISPLTVIEQSEKCIGIYGRSGTGKTHLAIALRQACKNAGILCINYGFDEWTKYTSIKRHDQGIVTQTEHVFALTKTFIDQIKLIEDAFISSSVSKWINELYPNNLDSVLLDYAQKYHTTSTSENIFLALSNFVPANPLRHQKIFIIAENFIDLQYRDNSGAIACARELMRIPLLDKFPDTIKMVFFVPEVIFHPAIKDLTDTGHCSHSINLSWAGTKDEVDESHKNLIQRRLAKSYGGDLSRLLAIGNNSITRFSEFFMSSEAGEDSDFKLSIDRDILDLLNLNAKINSDGIPTGALAIEFLNKLIFAICNRHQGDLPIPKHKWPEIKKYLIDHLWHSVLENITQSDHGFTKDPDNELYFYFGNIPVVFDERSQNSPKFLRFLIENPSKKIDSANFAQVRGDQPVPGKRHGQENFKQAKKRFKDHLNHATLFHLGDLLVEENQPISFKKIRELIKQSKSEGPEVAALP